MKKPSSLLIAVLASISLIGIARADNYTAGLYSQWVGDKYTPGSDWIDQIQGIDAALDAFPTPPISVSGPGLLGGHIGVERDPNGGANDGGFSIPQANAPTGYTNYTVAVVVLPTAQGPANANYYGSQLIIGYDIGGSGQADWGISWGGTTAQNFVAGIGLANGNDQQLATPAATLNATHSVALQVGNGTMSLFLDGVLSAQQTGLPLHAPSAPAVIPLLSSAGANIGQIFPGAVAEVRIYTNSTVDGAGLTAYLDTFYNYSGSITLSTNATGGIIGSNATVTLTVPANVTASSPYSVTLTSANTAVTASQTVTLPTGVTTTNLSFPILSAGSSLVTATATGLSLATVQISGDLPYVTFTPGAASSTVGNSAATTLTLSSPYPFSGPYTVNLASDTPGVAAGLSVTLPPGVFSTNLSFPILSTGVATLTGAGEGLNSGLLYVGTIPQLYSVGLYNDWVGDDYVAGSDWIDEVSQVDAALDGSATPPISVTGLFGSHKGVQRDPNGGASDGGFSIPGSNPPTDYTNYTVVAVVYPTATGPSNPNYYGDQLIIGYDIGGPGQADWGISWGGTNSQNFVAGIGVNNGVDQPLDTGAFALDTVHSVALQVGNGTMSLYIDGSLTATATNLSLHAPATPSVLPLLSTVGANIGQVFPGAVAEVRIYTNTVVNAAALTAYLDSHYSYAAAISVTTNSTGATVGSNAPVVLSVPPSVTANGSVTISLSSANLGVTASQTVTLAKGVTSTNLSFPILAQGTSAVQATGPNLTLAVVQVTGAYPTIGFAPPLAVSVTGSNAVGTLTLTSPYPFTGPYTVSLASDNASVAAAGQTITLPAGIFSTNLAFPILALGVANVTASGNGLNSAAIAVGTVPQVFADGLYNDWVGDDYVPGSDWIDRVGQVDAALDGSTTPPISVSGLFGSHKGVQRDPNGGGNDGGFSIPAANPPTGYTNYTVAAVFYPMAVGPVNGAYYGSQLIVGYDIGGAGQPDWGISWGGTTGSDITSGIGLADGSDQGLNTPLVAINEVHTVALQVSGNDTMSLYLDGALVAQATDLPLHAPANNNGSGVIPLLSSVASNIGQTFPGALGDLRIFTNAVIDAAALTTYMQTNNGGTLAAPVSPTILPVHFDATGTNLLLSVATVVGHNYLLESTTNLAAPIFWVTNSTTVGSGGTITSVAPTSGLKPVQFYRYLVQ